MVGPIEANYVPEGDDWAVTVVGRGKTLSARAHGLIAARDKADQLVQQLVADEEYHTVVHMLNGDAVEFTTAYLNARLGKPETNGRTEDAPANTKQAGTEQAEAVSKTGAEEPGDQASAKERGDGGPGEQKPEAAEQQA